MVLKPDEADAMLAEFRGKLKELIDKYPGVQFVALYKISGAGQLHEDLVMSTINVSSVSGADCMPVINAAGKLSKALKEHNQKP